MIRYDILLKRIVFHYYRNFHQLMSLCSQMTKSGFALQNIMDFMRSLRLSSCCCGLLCRSNEFGTPYLKAMYQFAMDHFESDFYGYVNADILLDSTIISSLQQIQRRLRRVLLRIVYMQLVRGQTFNRNLRISMRKGVLNQLKRLFSECF